MNKIIIIVLVVCLALGGFYLYSNMNSSSSNSTNNNSSNNNSNNNSNNTSQNSDSDSGDGFNGLLADAAKLGLPMKCTYSDETGTSDVYIKGKAMYMDVNQDGYKGSMLLKDECMWTWDSTEKAGFKMCFETPEGQPDMWENMAEDMESASESYDDMPVNPTDLNVKCSPAVLDNSKFEPPSDINFMSY